MLLTGFKDRSGLSYEELAGRASCSEGTAEDYLTKPDHPRGEGIFHMLLTALGVADAERDEVLRLHRLSRPHNPDPATSVWELEQFTYAEAAAHPATADDRKVTTSPPAYVPRDHDAPLRADIAAAARGELRAMIVLRGKPSTGKTRSLFEAVHALGPGWTVIRPRSAAAVRGLITSGLPHRRRCVLWLNELRTFLGPNGTGLSQAVLSDLFAATGDRDGGEGRGPHSLVVVATSWPEKFRGGAVFGAHLSDNRELLFSPNRWVRWHDIPDDFSARERDKARAIAARTGDDRLEAALTDRDHLGFVQTLGGHELVQHYLTAPGPMERLLLDAAGDARRLGHTGPLPAPLLRAIATALWRQEPGQAAPPPDWFDTAIAHATQGGQALIPLDHADPGDTEPEPVTYELADYLEQHLSHTRRAHPVTDAVWNALRQHTKSSADLRALAKAALARGRFRHGEALYRTAGTDAAGEFAGWLGGRPGREQEAEEAYRDAIAAGSFGAFQTFTGLLEAQPGREEETEQVYRDAITEGSVDAILEFAGRLAEQPGREQETEQAYRDAIAAGDVGAIDAFTEWLADQPGHEEKAEQVYWDAVAAGHPYAYLALTDWLAEQPGREQELERVYREAIAAGSVDAILEYAGWLAEQPGREEETAQMYRDAITAGEFGALGKFTGWLATQPGRDRDAERLAAFGLDSERLPRPEGPASA